MNKYQKYLNDEYRMQYEDANEATDEEVALMNPANPFDEDAFWYQERFGPVANAQRKVDTLINYIWHCRNLMSDKKTTPKDREELSNKIGLLLIELNKAKRELAISKFNSDELNTLFSNRSR